MPRTWRSTQGHRLGPPSHPSRLLVPQRPPRLPTKSLTSWSGLCTQPEGYVCDTDIARLLPSHSTQINDNCPTKSSSKIKPFRQTWSWWWIIFSWRIGIFTIRATMDRQEDRADLDGRCGRQTFGEEAKGMGALIGSGGSCALSCILRSSRHKSVWILELWMAEWRLEFFLLIRNKIWSCILVELNGFVLYPSIHNKLLLHNLHNMTSGSMHAKRIMLA